jgi:Zn-dependent protease
MDEIKIALAGPFSNAILAMVFSGIYIALPTSITAGGLQNAPFLLGILYYGIFINWGLFVFNLIPIPPLDGSHLLNGSFGRYAWYQWFQRFGIVILVSILLIQAFTDITILPIQNITAGVGMAFLELIGGR